LVLKKEETNLDCRYKYNRANHAATFFCAQIKKKNKNIKANVKRKKLSKNAKLSLKMI